MADLAGNGGPKPGLATVLVGADPASQVYVRSKGKLAVELGMASFDRKLPAETTEQELLSVIAELNADPAANALAPTQGEPPFAIAQGLLLVVFIVLAVLASRRFRPLG